MSPTTPTAALMDLFLAILSEQELRTFLTHRVPGGDRIVGLLPGNLASASHVADQTAQILFRQGLVTRELFNALQAEVPRRSREIERVAGLCGFPAANRGSAIQAVPAPISASAVRARVIPWLFIACLGAVAIGINLTISMTRESLVSEQPAHSDLPIVGAEVAKPAPVPAADGAPAPTKLIPAGEFTRGGRGWNYNYPKRKAWISAFEIDLQEVSIAEYKLCEAAGVCNAVTHKIPDDRPVEVPWDLAATYCKWRQARLPTEAEWEKAARGVLDVRDYPWGDMEPNCDQMNFLSCQDPPALRATDANPRGESPYGLLNMSGNAGEWVADLTTISDGKSPYSYNKYYMTAPEKDPQGPASGDRRTWKGGSYLDTSPWIGHIAMHGNGDPLTRRGFRCARSR